MINLSVQQMTHSKNLLINCRNRKARRDALRVVSYKEDDVRCSLFVLVLFILFFWSEEKGRLKRSTLASMCDYYGLFVTSKGSKLDLDLGYQ